MSSGVRVARAPCHARARRSARDPGECLARRRTEAAPPSRAAWAELKQVRIHTCPDSCACRRGAPRVRKLHVQGRTGNSSASVGLLLWATVDHRSAAYSLLQSPTVSYSLLQSPTISYNNLLQLQSPTITILQGPLCVT